MKATRIALAALLLIFFASPAGADDTNYQNYVIGQRALGMGGAFTALADDGSGAFYNPAGLALIATSSISASLSVYGWERRRLAEAVSPPSDPSVLVTRPDLASANVPTIPTTVGAIAKFGKRMRDGIRRFAGGFSVFVPHYTEFDFTGETRIGADPATADLYSVEILMRDKTLWQGPSISMRLTPRWSVGSAGFYVYRTTRWSSLVRQLGAPNADGMVDYFDEQRASVERNIHSLIFTLGARYDPTERWKLGLTVISPSITVHGKGKANTTTLTYQAPCINPPRCLAYSTFGGEVDADSRTPLSIRLGAAYRHPTLFTAALDVSWHAPLTYDPFDLGKDANQFGETGPVVLEDLERKMVFNVNVGGELVWRQLTVRSGFFTNLSSAPEVTRSAFAQPPRVHMYGVSLSVGYRWRGRTLSVGALYAFGRGKASALTPQDPAATENLPYGPVDERRDYVYFFITGYQAILKQGASRIIKKIGKEFFEKKKPAKKKPAKKKPARKPAKKKPDKASQSRPTTAPASRPAR